MSITDKIEVAICCKNTSTVQIAIRQKHKNEYLSFRFSEKKFSRELIPYVINKINRIKRKVTATSNVQLKERNKKNKKKNEIWYLMKPNSKQRTEVVECCSLIDENYCVPAFCVMRNCCSNYFHRDSSYFLGSLVFE